MIKWNGTVIPRTSLFNRLHSPSIFAYAYRVESLAKVDEFDRTSGRRSELTDRTTLARPRVPPPHIPTQRSFLGVAKHWASRPPHGRPFTNSDSFKIVRNKEQAHIQLHNGRDASEGLADASVHQVSTKLFQSSRRVHWPILGRLERWICGWQVRVTNTLLSQIVNQKYCLLNFRANFFLTYTESDISS